MKFTLLPILLASLTSATVIWDGRFADYNTTKDFDKWSWANQVGSWQTYIYGNTAGQIASDWLKLNNYTKPCGKQAKQVTVAITPQSFWRSGPMLRTELIPQTDSPLTGKLYFHVSLKIPSINPPSPNSEHQIVFWESHDAEIKYGRLSPQDVDGDALRYMTQGSTKWELKAPKKDVWYNFAFETASDGGLWYSEGAKKLVKVWTGEGGSGGKEFHVGHLRLNADGMAAREELVYAGVYVEDKLTVKV